MCALNYPEFVARADIDATSESDLYDLFMVGSKMFEEPNRRRILRLASASARAIAGCAILAVYIADGDQLARYSGKASHRLDLLVDARAGVSGVLENVGVWRYALFFHGAGTVKAAFVLQARDAPSPQALFLLSALAEPTGAALATAELIDQERRRANELRHLGDTQAGSNRTMATTIGHLRIRQHTRDSIVGAAGTSNGETQIIESLSVIIGRSVVLQDSFGRVRAFSGVGESAARSSAPAFATRDASDLPNTDWQFTPIRSRDDTLGVIGIHDPNDDQNDDDRFAVEFASAMIAVELAHHRRVAEVENRLGRDLADDLVAGAGGADSFARAEALGFNLSGLQRVVLISWEHSPLTGLDIGAAVRHEFAAMRVPALISRRPGTVLVVVGGAEDLSSLHERLSSTILSPRGTIGVGGGYIADALPRSFAEATRALQIRVESNRPYGLSSHDDLGLLRILDTSGDGAELRRYVDEWLGALVQHDRDHHSQLVHTLCVYLDSGGNYDRTAEALTIHRSTLRYRLGRIRELSGRDLTDPDSRLNLHVAVRARAAMRED
ncbi:MAG: helix-turn-helix domain-containing protein [Leifsonia flava]